MASRTAEVVRIFEHEPELLRRVPKAEAALAVRHTVVTCLRLPRGRLDPPAVRADAFDLGFLLLDGLLVHNVDVLGRRTSEVLGPGDVVRPWRPAEEGGLAPTTSWAVAEPTRLAILDRRFEQEVSRWPGVTAELLDRLAGRVAALSVQLALTRLPRLEDRLLALFWHLAERFGRVTSAGVLVELRLTQETLAELTSSRRQSVNRALGRLRDRDALVLRGPGRWVLRGDPPPQPAGAAPEPALA